MQSVAVGSHGETVSRLLRPGFHSGTLPKIYRKLRKLEHQDASLGRFTSRRSTREQLHHVEHAIQNFVERELISLLQKCPTWRDYPLRCTGIDAASNSFCVHLACSKLSDTPLQLRIQEQSGWLVASMSSPGWLSASSTEQANSFLNALEGFYRKCGIDLVREQLESTFTKNYPYDIESNGLLVWPTKSFDVEISADLKTEWNIQPLPAIPAVDAGLVVISREEVVFSATQTAWDAWEQLWNTSSTDAITSSSQQPPACTQTPKANLYRA